VKSKLQNGDVTFKRKEPTFTSRDECDFNFVMPTPPPLEIISDLGLTRPIYSANELATLLIREIEELLWHDRMEMEESTKFVTYIIRAASSGLIGMVTPNRIIFLQNAGRLPCRNMMCMKWCKGEKGLWWHEQREHGIEHSNATVAAASCFGVNDFAMVVFQNNNTNTYAGDVLIPEDTARELGIQISDSTVHTNNVDPITSQCTPLDRTSLKATYFQLVKEGSLDKFNKFILSQTQVNADDAIDPRSYLDRNGASAIHWAAGCGHLEMAEYFIKEYRCSSDQPQLGKRSFLGRTPLHWAARNGHLNVVAFLVEECTINIDATTVDGTTAFCWSCWQGHLHIMQ